MKVPHAHRSLTLTVILLMAAGAALEAQCTPETQHEAHNRAKYASPDDTLNVMANGGSYVPDVSNGRKNGHHRKCSAEFVEAHADVFLWAKDGAVETMTFEARATRDYKFVTRCIPFVRNESIPPVGDGYHDVTAELELSYSVVGGAGTSSRAASLAALWTSPTGANFSVNYTLGDNATVSEVHTLDVHNSGALGAGLSTPLSGSAFPVLRALFGGGPSANVSSSANFNAGVSHTQSRTGNQAVAVSEVIRITDTQTIITECHALMKTGLEAVEFTGSATIGSTGGPVQVAIDCDMVSRCTVQSFPFHVCKSREIYPGSPNPMPPPVVDPPGGTTPGGGGNGGTTPGGSGGTTPGGNGGAGAPPPGGGPTSRPSTSPDRPRCLGLEGKGTSDHVLGVPLGGGKARFWCIFPHAPSAASTLWLRVSPSCAGTVNMTGTARAVRADAGTQGLAPYDFDPFQPLVLPSAGQWWVDIDFTTSGRTMALFEMSFDAAFPTENTAYAGVECIDAPFSVREWIPGVHIGADESARRVSMSGVDAKLWLEPVRPERWQGAVPIVTDFVVTSGPTDLVWHRPPSIGYDSVQDVYYLTMAPNAPVSVRVELSSGEHSFFVPVRFLEATPLH